MERIHASDILNATFQFIREHIRAVAVWSAIYLAVGIGAQLAMVRLLTMQLTATRAGMAGLDVNQIVQSVLVASLLYVLAVAVIVVLQAAVFRAAMYPERQETSYLRLGMDELRLFGLLFGLGIGLFILFIVGTVLVAMAVGGLVALGSVFKALGILVAILGFVALFVAPVFVAVRLASAGPLTILRGRITVREAWRLTRGHFWTLFGSYAVIGVVSMVALGTLIPLSFGSDMQQSMMQQMLHPNDTLLKQQYIAMQIQQYGDFGPARWLPLALGAIVGGILIALQCGSIAVATRLLLNKVEPASVF